MKTRRWLLWWEERLTSWGEISAGIWADYWLLLIGAFLVLGGVVLKWVEFPFSNNLSGLELPLLNAGGVIPHVSLFSFGAIGVILLLMGLLAIRVFSSAFGLVATILLTLWVLTPAHIAFQQPKLLRRLTDELEILPLKSTFTMQYLPENYGSSEVLPKRLLLYTGWGRLLAAWSFLRLGWYCLGLGSLLILIHALRRLPTGRASTGLLLLCLPAGALAIVLIPPIVGQHYLTKGSIAKARGHDQEAIANYRKAMRWDGWNAQEIDLYVTIGQLQKHAGLAPGSPERHIRRAVEFRETNQFEAAIFEFTEAAAAGGAIGAAAERAAVSTQITLGLALYESGGIGSAVANWEAARAMDPIATYVLFYLARGYYDIGRYQAGIEAVNRLTKIVSDHTSALADAYSLGGDCAARLGRVADARRYYNLSFSADSEQNYWALSRLIGE